ncbi:MAG: hypothetical protein AB7H88_20060 [Vicinamibacterales bacterium]
MHTESTSRRSLITGLGAAAAGVALATRPARAATAAGAFTPARHEEDAWFDGVPGVHRVFIDSGSAEGASDALLYANNIFNANKSGYGLDEKQIAIIVCFRHRSTPFGFSNAMWEKYGESLTRMSRYELGTGETPPRKNPQWGTAGSPRGIEGLAGRGVQFAICDMATHGLARQIAGATGGDDAAIYKDLRANAIPNAHFVAAGVVGVTRAQEYGYSLLVAG